MGSLRHLLRARPALVGTVLALVLLLKLLVPAGYMPMVSTSGVGLAVCNGMTHAAGPMAMPGMTHGGHHRPEGSGKPDSPCAFAGLNAPGLGGVDAVLLAALLVAIVAGGVRAGAVQRVPRTAFLHPPSHGPPLPA